MRKIIFESIKRHYSVKRKFPINPEESKELPVFQYAIGNQVRNRVYVWGNVQTGALGVRYMKPKHNYRLENLKCPKRLHFAEHNEVTLAACGFGFTIYAVNSAENKLYGTGLNTDSQIGTHEIQENKPLGIVFFPQPIYVPVKSKIKKLAAGRAHAAALCDEGLFLIGNNSYGQCGREIVENESYVGNKLVSHLEQIDNKNIIDVECGQDHTMVILEDGSVYACGWGADGQTGLGHYNVVPKFKKLNGDISKEVIVKLSCKSDFVLALNDKGETFGWGNTEYSQITTTDNSQQICNPTYLKMLEPLGKIKSVASGGSFCSVLNNEGQVYVWGYGLLGVGIEVQESKAPILIPPQLFGYNQFMSDSQVVSIACGLGHMAAVTNHGDLFTWGRNRNCCLGLGFDKDQYFPLKVALGAFVKSVHCGLDHTIAICKSYLSNK